MTDRIANPWGERTPYGASGAASAVAEELPEAVRELLPGDLGTSGTEWPVRVDRFLEEGVSEEDVDRWVQTASILHANADALGLGSQGGHF